MRKALFFTVVMACFLLCSCGGGSTPRFSGGDTLRLKYAERLTIVRHKNCTEVVLADPWNNGKTLHRYLLVPDSLTEDSLPDGLRASGATVVSVPLKRAVIATSAHCNLVMTLGRADAIRGVCDLRYINLPWIRQQCAEGRITDCGNGTTPTLEKIIEADADALLISPFQNSGGYGRLAEWGNPIIELADYMETSPLGRAEWMKFYGMLFGEEERADSLFAVVEANYIQLKEAAAKSQTRLEIITDKVTGSVWYVPGGRSTIGRMIADANAAYAFAADESSGSLPLAFETVLDKAGNADVWMFRHGGERPATYASLLTENAGYAHFKAFREHRVYVCNTTGGSTFYEDTPFRPDLLLRDLIIITHPDMGELGTPKYMKALD